MNVFTVSSKIILGRQTENGICTLQFPISKWIEKYGSGGTFHLFNKRSQDTNAYPVTITSDDEYVYWTPSTADVQYAGFGEAQLDYTFGTYGESNYRKACSEVFKTYVERSIETSSTVPSAYQAWVTQVEGYADRAEEAEEKIENMTATASVNADTGTPSVTVTKTETSEGFNLDFAFENLKGDVGSVTWNDIQNKPTTVSGFGITDTYTKTEEDTALADKVDKVTGKGLSTNDYDNVEKAKVTDAYADKHTHSNKALLDTYDQTNADITDAISKKHEHSNKALLDTIPSSGTTGHVLKKTASGTEWANESGAVSSVNGQTGTVVLDGADINVDDTATTPQTIKAALEAESSQIVALQNLGLTVVDGKINITYTEE